MPLLFSDEREALLPDDSDALLREVELPLFTVEVLRLLPEELLLFTVEVLRLRLLPPSEAEVPLDVEGAVLLEFVARRTALPALTFSDDLSALADVRLRLPEVLRLSAPSFACSRLPVVTRTEAPVERALRRLASESILTVRLLASREETVTYPAAKSLRLFS